MTYKKIKFIPNNEFTEKVELPPTNAGRSIPDWYKNTSQFYMDGKEYHDVVKVHKDSFNSKQSTVHASMKLCQPFIDALTSGYIVRLPTSIMVIKDNYGQSVFKWQTAMDLVDFQDNAVLGHFKAPEGYNPQFFRWINMWKVQTPPGYSSLFTHPFNRFDLPFTTLTGIVDTDLHPNPVILPFFIKDDFEGIIEEGTPIAQIIPFKRDNWESELLTSDSSQKYGTDIIRNSFIRTYKKKFWSKKIYK
jgi:hypothetical protein